MAYGLLLLLLRRTQALGWGAGVDSRAMRSEDAIAAELRAVLSGVPVRLDRWNVSIYPAFAMRPARPAPGGGGGGGGVVGHRSVVSTPNRVMVNYLSIGVCAAIALDFHELRRTAPALFCSRVMNKLL